MAMSTALFLLFCGIIGRSRRAADDFMQGQENVSLAQSVAACAVHCLCMFSNFS
jgi:hypothetical protein